MSPRGDEVAAVAALGGAVRRRLYDYVVGECVRLRNCPFHAIAETHRALVCGMNLALLAPSARRPGRPA